MPGKSYHYRNLAYKVLPDNILLDEKEWNLAAWTLILTDKCCDLLSQRLNTKNVVELNLSGADRLSDDGLRCLTSKMHSLEKISLENAYQITDEGIDQLVNDCSNIRSLNLAGCLGLSGNSFAILGQHSKKLHTLNLAGNVEITSWAFMKIFQGCTLLEHVDVSYCILITDQELKFLADSCKSLKYLNIQACRQISDVGILSLSKGSGTLEQLSMSRTELVGRITDVSLLAIAEGCPRLKVIDVSGCEMITDVGISWLAKGCRELHSIYFVNCCKITNNSMRYLSEECKQLKIVAIKNDRKISDVGLRYLATNCNHLETINASGLALLTDGVDRNFGFEGIQSLGHEACRSSLLKLNLHGCFRVSKVALKSIASMVKLKSLTLSNCKSLCVDSLISIFRKCVHLAYLSLAGCGDCISDSVLIAVGENLSQLKFVDASDCPKLTRSALQGLSLCKHLEYLNISGCKRICDEAILGLGEGHFEPGIVELHLNRCQKLSNIAVTWITDSFLDESGVVSIRTLALKGTKISYKTLQGVEMLFPYSTIKSNGGFHGFLSLSRAKNCQTINAHARKSRSIAKIQAILRANKVRSRLRDVRLKKKKIQKAILIQNTWRRYCSKKLSEDLRKQKNDQRRKAIIIQKNARCYLSKLLLSRLRFQTWKRIAPLEATKIQACYRRFRANILVKSMFHKKAQREELEERSIMKIQATMRSFLARQALHTLKLDFLRLQQSMRKACIRIQCKWRSELAWRESCRIRLELFNTKRAKYRAAKTITRLFRRILFCGLIQSRVELKRILIRAASLLQRWFRNILELRELKRLEQVRKHEERQSASTLIQCYVRKWQAKCLFRKKRRAKEMMEKQMIDAARSISGLCRIILAKKQMKELQKQRKLQLEWVHQLRTKSATEISSWWRGCQGRKRALEVQKAKQNYWKEMWSEEDQRPFYYNKKTKESSWTKPKELLNLEPRPLCSNCEIYDAQLHCNACQEYFCLFCFKAIHFNGKRKAHDAYTLYDYWNNRIAS